jgi:Ni/Fe-hydrogenase subunit HybB-like protein
MEIGRWDNFYWFFISGAFTSPLYEVAICITLYIIVQVFEILEIWGDRYKPWLKWIVRFFLPFFVLLGAVIPFGQQMAYGALYLAMPGKLHALWYSQFLPWGCLISAFYGGLCFIALEYNLSNRYFREKSDDHMIGSLLRIAGVAMAVYLLLKGMDLSFRGVWGEVFTGSTEGNLFLMEIIVGSVIPVIIMLTPLVKNKKYQLIAALCGVLGVMLNRFNFIFSGMADYADMFYFPSAIEIGIVVGLIALVIVLYLFLVENLPVFRNKEDKKPEIVIK